MNEQLIAFFDQITPAELDTLLGNDFEREPLEYDAVTRIQNKVRTALRARRRPRRTLFWAIAAVLAVMIGVGAAALLSSAWRGSHDPVAEVLPTADREPVVSQYDIFSDPNVLWGSEENMNIPNDIPYEGRVIISDGLKELMSLASEENLVAFTVQLPGYCEIQPIDMDRLALPDTLIEDAFLRKKIEAFNETDDMYQCEGLYSEIETYVDNRTSSEEYLSFFRSWQLLESEGVRARFVEAGFTPVYELEDLYQREYSAEEILTFVGTTQAIRQMKEKVIAGEYYILQTTGYESFNLPT